MNWITEISINNYRAFGKPENISIPEGNHLLIYGENGSGKSSIYNALKDFFSSSFTNSQVNFKLNKFQEENDNKTGNITIRIVDNANNQNYKFGIPNNLSNNKIPKIQLANKVKGFLDYKKMLQLHALNIPDNEQPDVFNLVVNEILGEHKINDLNGGVTQVSLIDAYNDLQNKIFIRERDDDYEEIFSSEHSLNERLKEISESINNQELEDEKYLIYDLLEKHDAINLLKKFNSELVDVFKKVFERVNDYLKLYFKNKLFIDIDFRAITYNEKEDLLNEYLKLKVKYADIEIDGYHSFLNEARLSSLAICIYLASISIYSENVNDDIPKILYLDDIFIGLDTSNRFPLLEIIKKEFMDKGFQVFISSYDREWFELSKYWFETKGVKIKGLELFTESDDSINIPDYPVVIPSIGNLEKAKAYFKSKDYTASGNYLRKACEEIISKILPETYKIKKDSSKTQDLETLFTQLKTFFNKCNITENNELINSAQVFRKGLLNPTSHNDLKSPIFRAELENAFQIVKKLEALYENELTKKLIELFKLKNNFKFALKKGEKLFYSNKDLNYSCEIELLDYLFIYEDSGNKKFTNHKFKIINWKKNDIDYYVESDIITPEKIQAICSRKRDLKDIFDLIAKSINISKPENMYSQIETQNNKKLSSFLE